mgnify:CR=1 FL=1
MAASTLAKSIDATLPGTRSTTPLGLSISQATSNRSFMATSRRMANGDEQSNRILPSESSVMNRNVGSTSGFTTVRSRPYLSPIAPQ